MRQLNEFHKQGFMIIDNVYTTDEILAIAAHIHAADTDRETFRKSNDLFAIRQFLKEVPDVSAILFNNHLKSILQELLGEHYFIVKSIYFDKPPASNWYVPYHQDLTISVDKKLKLEGFDSWTTKQNQFAVQPPLDILQHIVTVRIHLDDTDEHNGALRIIPQSHSKGIYRPETIDWSVEKEDVCPVASGGIMLMRPLLLHRSDRTTNGKQRRVIHLEFSNRELPEGLNWSERMGLN